VFSANVDSFANLYLHVVPRGHGNHGNDQRVAPSKPTFSVKVNDTEALQQQVLQHQLQMTDHQVNSNASYACCYHHHDGGTPHLDTRLRAYPHTVAISFRKRYAGVCAC